VTPHGLYRRLARLAEERRAAYRKLFADELGADVLGRLRECTNGGYVLGSAKFERKIADMVGRRTWKGLPGRPRNDGRGAD
jgi:putative transposase